jgi:tRNA-dihydrouridine synthase B
VAVSAAKSAAFGALCTYTVHNAPSAPNLALRLPSTCRTVPQPPLASPFRIGNVTVVNRVLLAPLAGIGNWFVRLQARRYGAGLAVSEMISSIALARGNRRTRAEMLRIHPAEHPVSVQLFGGDPAAMREAAWLAAEAGADAIDLNLGCPVPKVCKAGAGAALLDEPDRAIELARAAAAPGLPVTAKLRGGLVPGDRSGFDLALRLAAEAGVAAIAFHPRSASDRHSGRPDYDLARELAERAPIPVILSGGLRTAASTLEAYARSGAAAVMIARGALGYPWIFEELAQGRIEPPTPRQILAELGWTLERATEHWGAERAVRNLRKLYPHYLARLGIRGRDLDAVQRAPTLGRVRELVGIGAPLPLAA